MDIYLKNNPAKFQLIWNDGDFQTSDTPTNKKQKNKMSSDVGSVAGLIGLIRSVYFGRRKLHRTVNKNAAHCWWFPQCYPADIRSQQYFIIITATMHIAAGVQ